MQNQKNLDLGGDENEEEEDADAEEIQKHGPWSTQLLKAAQKGDIDWVKRALDKKANINEQDKNKKWNALIWAACKNYIELARLLISRGAAQQYLRSSQLDGTLTNTSGGLSSLLTQEKKVKQGVINNQVRQTPLQWACFQGNYVIVWLLLKAGCSWQDVDAFGNNCAHLAASGGNLRAFQTLLMYGIDVNDRNSRNHEVLDLAADTHIHTLVQQHKEATRCHACKVEFGDMIRKHWCSTCQNFFCENQFQIQWTWETDKSEEMERLDGKCHRCWANIQMHTDELVMKMHNYDHKQLTDKINEVKKNNIEIDLKIFRDALVMQEKLRTQNMITAVLDSLKHVDNYKTILKSVNQIEEMLADAKTRGVLLDENIVERAQKEHERLVAERNLRYELDNIDSGNCNPEQVAQLTTLMSAASEQNVEKQYLDVAELLRDKMSRSIETQDIYQMFVQYPTRIDWRPCVKFDPKLKKAIDPETKKPPDLKKFLAPQQKSKKNQLPMYPEWATETLELEQQIQRIQVLLQSAEELELDQKFVDGAVLQIDEMKQEWKYRRELDTEKKLLDEIVEAQQKQQK